MLHSSANTFWVPSLFEVFSLLGCYTAYIGSFFFTYVLGQLFSPNFKGQAVQTVPIFHADDAVLLWRIIL
jgi:hypothetical protein